MSNGEKERLLSLNGEAREVIRDNQNLTCIWPSSRKVVVDFSRKNTFSPIFIPDDIARLEKFYEMKLLGKTGSPVWMHRDRAYRSRATSTATA